MSRGVVHGGASAEELAAARAAGVELLDLSANLNPYGPHPAVVAAAAGAEIRRYPEPDAGALRRAWAPAFGVDPGQVLAGNGSSELIYLVCRALGAGGRCLVFGPTFGEYTAAARAAGMAVVEAPYPGGPANRHVDPVRFIEEVRPALVFLCSPNNPTGELCATAQVEAIAAAVRRAGGRLVVDEAYQPFAWPEDEGCAPGAGVLVIRSLTKLHAVPGLRLGFLLGEEGEIAAVEAQQPPWSVGAPAAAAGMAALDLGEFCRDSVRRVAATRAILFDALEELGLAVRPSLANFLLVGVGNGARFRQVLLERRAIVVRDCASFGLPDCIRVAVPHERDIGRVIEAMKEVQEWLAAES